MWDWFRELSETRQLSGTAMTVILNRITHQEIKAWAELAHVDPLPWEMRLLKSLDRVYCEVFGPGLL